VQPFRYLTEPYPLQRVSIEEHADLEAWAHFHEQGCGKAKIGIDTAARQFDSGRIRRVLVLAPNGVHRNWAWDEIPKHMPEWCRARTFIWEPKKVGSPKSPSRRYLDEAAQMLKPHDGLTIVTMGKEAMVGKWAKRFSKRFVEGEPCLVLVDESHHWKTPGIKRTHALYALGRRAVSRRLFSGTYVDEGPFDIYAPINFLDPTFWSRQSPGFPAYEDFKTYFGHWTTGYNRKLKREYPKLRDEWGKYRNLPVLREMLSTISDRVLLKEMRPDMPDHIFTTRSFDLPPSWRRAYEELDAKHETRLERGERVTADLSIVRSHRLHQICCGYVATDDGKERGKPLTDLPGPNPRLELAEALAADLGRQAIIWAAWTPDINKLMDMLGKRAVRFDGKVDEAGRDRAKAAIKAGDAQFLVGNPGAGGEGHTILVPSMIYYSLGYKARQRSQSLGRNRRPGAEEVALPELGGLEVLDIQARGTKDEVVVGRLKDKKLACDVMTGDYLK
jgi:hypothetical protein